MSDEWFREQIDELTPAQKTLASAILREVSAAALEDDEICQILELVAYTYRADDADYFDQDSDDGGESGE